MKTFAEFWPFYLREHSNKTCRVLHYTGTTISLIAIMLGAFLDVRYFWLAPIGGYGFAWVGHFVFENNKPATFQHPLWSLAADYRMYFSLLLGRLGAELVKAGVID